MYCLLSTVTMGYRKISTDLKECCLHLWRAGWSQSDICSAFCVSPVSLYCWQATYTTIRSTDWWQETKFPDWHQTHNLSAIQLTAILRLALSSWFSAGNHISTSFATNVLCSPFYKIRDLTYGSHIEGLQEAYYNQYTKYMFIAYKCC